MKQQQNPWQTASPHREMGLELYFRFELYFSFDF